MSQELPLAGMKVVDLSQFLAGPYCSMFLADFGAEVVKVEMPGVGDGYRSAGPPFKNGVSACFLSVNRNKKSVTIDLKKPRGREMLLKLLADADVLLENFRPGTMEKLGLDYDVVSEVNPAIIYCSISAYGQTGPSALKGGFDLILQGVGGIMGITGQEDGPPVKAGVSVTDVGAGLLGAFAILTAYAYRQRTGLGQHIDTSLLECAVSWHSFMASAYFMTGQVPTRLGSAHSVAVPYQAFKTKDGYINVAAATQALWETLCRVLNAEHLLGDTRFVTGEDRLKNRAELVAIIEEFFAADVSEAWLSRLDEAGLPCGPIYRFDQLFEDPQVLHREMVVEMEHPQAGRIKTLAVPIKLSRTPGSIRTAPPLLGEHTREVLLSLGYSDDDIEALRNDKVI